MFFTFLTHNHIKSYLFYLLLNQHKLYKVSHTFKNFMLHYLKLAFLQNYIHIPVYLQRDIYWPIC